MSFSLSYTPQTGPTTLLTTNSLRHADAFTAAARIQSEIDTKAGIPNNFSRSGSAICPGCGQAVTCERDPRTTACRHCTPSFSKVEW